MRSIVFDLPRFDFSCLSRINFSLFTQQSALMILEALSYFIALIASSRVESTFRANAKEKKKANELEFPVQHSLAHND